MDYNIQNNMCVIAYHAEIGIRHCVIHVDKMNKLIIFVNIDITPPPPLISLATLIVLNSVLFIFDSK